jgi:hypothetical protein
VQLSAHTFTVDGAKTIDSLRVLADGGGAARTVALCSNKSLRFFEWPAPAVATAATLKETPAHQKRIHTLAVSADGQWLVTASADGSLAITRASPIAHAEAPSVVPIHDVLLGGARCAVFNLEGTAVISAGADGALFVVSVDQQARHCCEDTQAAPLSAVTMAEVDAEEPRMTTLFNPAKAARGTEASLVSQLSRLRMRLSALKAQFADALEKNANAPTMERVDRADLVVDLDENARLKERADGEVQAVRDSIRLANVEQDLLWHRIKASCYDSMEAHSVILSSIPAQPTTAAGGLGASVGNAPSSLAVANFAVAAVGGDNNRIVEQVQALRMAEKRNWAWNSSQGIDSGVATDDQLVQHAGFKAADQPTNAAAAAPEGKVTPSAYYSYRPSAAPTRSHDCATARHVSILRVHQVAVAAVATSALDKDKDREEGAEDDRESALPEGADDGRLLYSWYHLDCDERKRSQILLLGDATRSLRRSFNAEFEKATKRLLRCDWLCACAPTCRL